MSTEFQSLRGMLLLDSGQLRGSCFHRAVVLVCQHASDGAFGLILNQPIGATMGEAVESSLIAAQKIAHLALFLGGPVKKEFLSYLHSDLFLPDADVMLNLEMGHSIETLTELASSVSSNKKLRCFAGYSGWTGGQLESEIERKAWVLHPASLEYVFTEDPGNLWKTILRAKGWQYRLLADQPDDLSAN